MVFGETTGRTSDAEGVAKVLGNMSECVKTDRKRKLEMNSGDDEAVVCCEGMHLLKATAIATLTITVAVAVVACMRCQPRPVAIVAPASLRHFLLLLEQGLSVLVWPVMMAMSIEMGKEAMLLLCFCFRVYCEACFFVCLLVCLLIFLI